jgi:UDP-3-O-[3-hydroxymyristoyl] glucosamine N-acyltransferase
MTEMTPQPDNAVPPNDTTNDWNAQVTAAFSRCNIPAEHRTIDNFTILEVATGIPVEGNDEGASYFCSERQAELFPVPKQIGMHDKAYDLTPDGAVISRDAIYGPEAIAGARTIIHPSARVAGRTIIGKACIIEGSLQDAILGDSVTMHDFARAESGVSIGHSTEIGESTTLHRGVVLGENVTIDSHTTISNGARVGNGTEIGKSALIWDDVLIGSKAVIADEVHIDNDCVVGDRAELMEGVKLDTGATVGEDAHLYPAVKVRRGACVGANADVLPGLEIPEKKIIQPYRVVVGKGTKITKV